MTSWAEGYRDGVVHATEGKLRGTYREIYAYIIGRDFRAALGVTALHTYSIPFLYPSGFDSLLPKVARGFEDKDDEYWEGYSQAIVSVRYITKKEIKKAKVKSLKKLKTFSAKKLDKKINSLETNMDDASASPSSETMEIFLYSDSGEIESTYNYSENINDLKKLKLMIMRYKYDKLG